MADKSFEEQVRRELEQLRMQPDAFVWENVRQALKRKKRRYAFYWLIGCILLTGAGWVTYERMKQPPTSGHNSSSQTIAPPTTSTVTPADQHAISNAVKPSQTDLTAGPAKGRANNGPASAQETGQPLFPKPSAGNAAIPGKQAQPTLSGHAGNKLEATGHTVEAAPAATKQAPAPTGGLQQHAATAVTATATGDVTGGVVGKSSDNSERGTTLPDTVSQYATRQLSDSSQSNVPAEQGSAVTKVKKRRRPWVWQVMAEAGMAGNASPDPYTGSPQNIGTTIGNNNPVTGGAFSGAYRRPSEKNGYYMSGQVQALAPMGKMSYLGISMGYAQYNYVVGIGRLLDSASSYLGNAIFANKSDDGKVYLSTDSIPYRNRFHYLTFGMDYYLPFVLRNNWVLRWRAGMDAGLLLSGNALHFDEAAGVLYRNRSLLHSARVGLSTGIDLGIGKHPVWYIGPHFYYSLTTASSPSSAGRLWAASLRATMTLQKRKPSK